MSSGCVEAALAALDHALVDRADHVYDDLVEAMRCIIHLRAELIAERRNGEPRDHLERCNAVLSLVIGGEYPLVGIRRERLRQARQELAALVQERR
jgi:hypothetical protein